MKTWIIAVIVIVIIAGAIAFILTHGPPHASKYINTTNTSSSSTEEMTSTNVTTSNVSSNSSMEALPPGAIELNYNAQNKTVFIYLYASPTAANPLNFNGTTEGQMKIYIPENWSILFTFYNPEPVGHALAVVDNNTPIPNQVQLSQDGKIIFEIGYNGGSGIYNGETVSGLLHDLPPGYYWIACPIPTHAESGMWVDLISTNVTVPYEVV
ncbi:MAG: sulfocyanin-like copper-binding protein [Metallosphaera sp.]